MTAKVSGNKATAPAIAAIAVHEERIKELLKERDMTAKQIWRLLSEAGCAPAISRNNPTVIQTQKEGGSLLENILGGKMLKDMLPKKFPGAGILGKIAAKFRLSVAPFLPV